MMGPAHQVVGVSSWLVACPELGVHGWPVLAGAVVAGATAHGRLSPDADRYPWLGKIIPGGHRSWTHWWPFPLLIAYASRFAGPFWWLVLAVAVAWASHIVADAVFGKVPLLPRARGWQTAGLGFRTGGVVERVLVVPAVVVAGVWALAVSFGYDPHQVIQAIR